MDLNDKGSILQGEGTAMRQRSQGRKVLSEIPDPVARKTGRWWQKEGQLQSPSTILGPPL